MPGEAERLRRRIRALIGVFIAGLVLSGVTAFPLLHELNLLAALVAPSGGPAPVEGGLIWWILRVRTGLAETHAAHPFLAYGTDWLAFGHLVIALFFVAAWRDPVRNRAALDAGLIACLGVIPLALICGEVRGIPVYWRLIDCSFGVGGLLCLWPARRLTQRLEEQMANG
ncbi:MAG: hypothetical protein QOE70_5574 [Chthoniobacter sp.]|jgi:CBS-domain-containing membrane protein|nr:hypothetical protein [Chthoniobacter sp.]